MSIKTFANWLEGLQVKRIDNDRNQCILEEVKLRKFLNHLPDYISTTLVLQLLDSWTFNDQVKKEKSYEAVQKHGRIPSTPKLICQPSTQHSLNPGRNHCRDWKTDNKKTSFIPGRNPATKRTSTKDPDLEVVNETLILQDMIKLISDRKCLWCFALAHTFKEYKKPISKQPIYTAAQVLSLQQTSKPVIIRNNYKEKT